MNLNTLPRRIRLPWTRPAPQPAPFAPEEAPQALAGASAAQLAEPRGRHAAPEISHEQASQHQDDTFVFPVIPAGPVRIPGPDRRSVAGPFPDWAKPTAELLGNLLDGLRSLDTGPAAWLRAVQPDGRHLDTALTGTVRFTRVITPRRGSPARFAEVEMGSSPDGPYRIAASRDWLKNAAMVFFQAADALGDPEPGVPAEAVPATGGAR